jgi:hypothetical protein
LSFPEKREERIEKRIGGFALQNKKREEAEETTISDRSDPAPELQTD